ncbi:MAG: phosphatase PAP2 family protein, partial [Gammaproteobacteria bacterium]|nr:phosphatase PAP2 family protein [Gammaproteobacteria bacterium]
MTAIARLPRMTWTQASVPVVAALALLVVWFSDSNAALFDAFNRIARSIHDFPWGSATMLGEALVIFPLLTVVHHRWPMAGWAVVFGGIVTGLAVISLKAGIGTLRPPAVLAPEYLHIIGPTLRFRAFPSGHTATAFLVATVVIFYTRRWWLQWGVGLAALVVGLSRMAVGAHWPTDVLGGVVLGWLGAWIGVVLAERWQGARSARAQYVLLLMFMGSAVALFVD